jgi:hypothetical protein
MSMGIPTSVMIYYCTVFPCLLAGFRPTYSLFPTQTRQSILAITLLKLHTLGGSLLHIIFFTPMTVNDVNLSFVFRRISGSNS